MHLKLSLGNWRPFCLDLNVITAACIVRYHDVGLLELKPRKNRVQNHYNTQHILLIVDKFCIKHGWQSGNWQSKLHEN